MSALKKIKKDKGFTLVEIIVVLVILAVLAAFTIPTMLGFVEEAKGKAYIAEAREVYVAAQATATEWTATDPSKVSNTSLSSKAVSEGWPKTATHATLTMRNYLIEDMIISTTDDPPTTWQKHKAFWKVELNEGKVIKVEYYRNNYKVIIEVGGLTSVEKIA